MRVWSPSLVQVREVKEPVGGGGEMWGNVTALNGPLWEGREVTRSWSWSGQFSPGTGSHQVSADHHHLINRCLTVLLSKPVGVTTFRINEWLLCFKAYQIPNTIDKLKLELPQKSRHYFSYERRGLSLQMYQLVYLNSECKYLGVSCKYQLQVSLQKTRCRCTHYWPGSIVVQNIKLYWVRVGQCFRLVPYQLHWPGVGSLPRSVDSQSWLADTETIMWWSDNWDVRHTNTMSHQQQKAESKSEFLFKDSYIEDLEFVYEPSFLERQLSDQSRCWDWEHGGKKMSRAKHISVSPLWNFHWLTVISVLTWCDLSVGEILGRMNEWLFDHL